MGTGLIAILLSVLFVKVVPIKTPEEFKYQAPKNVKQRYGAFRAMSPYIYMLILLPVVRYGVPAMASLGSRYSRSKMSPFLSFCTSSTDRFCSIPVR